METEWRILNCQVFLDCSIYKIYSNLEYASPLFNGVLGALLQKNAISLNFLCILFNFILVLKCKRVFLLPSTRNLDHFYERGQGERSRRYASFGVLQFAVPTLRSVFGRMAMGNSPFGAWVVCVYRSEAVESPV